LDDELDDDEFDEFGTAIVNWPREAL